MEKVAFSVSRYSNNDLQKLKGVGYICDTNLVISCLSKNNKPYIRVFDNVTKYIHELDNRPGEYGGNFSEYINIDDRTIEITYYIWFTYLDKNLEKKEVI